MNVIRNTRAGALIAHIATLGEPIGRDRLRPSRLNRLPPAWGQGLPFQQECYTPKGDSTLLHRQTEPNGRAGGRVDTRLHPILDYPDEILADLPIFTHRDELRFGEASGPPDQTVHTGRENLVLCAAQPCGGKPLDELFPELGTHGSLK